MPRPTGWLRARMGVRAISALSAAIVVALALMVAGAALVLLVQESLRASVKDEATQQAQLIATRIAGNYEGQSNKNARKAIEALTRESEDLAQVLVEYGRSDRKIEASTDPVGKDVPISDLWPEEGEIEVVPNTPILKTDGTTVDAVLVAAGTDSLDHDVVVLFAVPLTAVEAATNTVLFYLLLGVPLLIVVAGVTTYLFAGRALRPVEAIRAQVAEMTGKDLGRRVPVPPARDEVGRLAETMNGMIARLQDAQGVQRRFVADASHELRSPLATIATGLELMQNGTADRGTVTALRGETSRLNKLVEGLILLARADERGLQPRREEVDLDEVVDQERGRPADGAVVAEVQAAPVRVVGDRGQLARVVRNLVDNARRHARSRVLVTAGREGDMAVLEVADDGPGVPAADRARVFERFVRLDDARARSDGGSGLGLAIVAEVVAAHGGSVEVTDAPGGGALFRVRIPAAAAPDAHQGEAAPAGRQAAAAEPATEAAGPAPAGQPAAAVPLTKPTPVPRSAGPAEPARSGEPAQPGKPARRGAPAPPGRGAKPGKRGRRAEPARSRDAARSGDAAWTGEAAWTGDSAWTGEAAWTGDSGLRAEPVRGDEPMRGGDLFREAEPAPGAEPTPPAPPGPRPVPQPRGADPGAAPTRPLPVEQRPVRDEDARRDPVTAPHGIPAVTPDEKKPAPARAPVPAPRPQPGSAMR
jgi:signal transduction histidine kinase